MENMVISDNVFTFFKGKRVFITGHTGFKGTWLCRMLLNAGAILTGYSLEPPTNPNLFKLADLESHMNSIIGDIRDYYELNKAFQHAQPEIVIHLAAQPLVRESYKDPRYTYETNVMGTVNLLECIRQATFHVRSVLIVTTDKVYKNNEWFWGYREDEPLNGFDPYSNSKSCSELVTHSYSNCFFSKTDIAVSSARAGNVIGGGDFAADRIIPDCVRAVIDGKVIGIRNPNSIRPYQHVLEPIYAYLLILSKQYVDRNYSGYYNVGPDESDCITTGELADLFCRKWGDGVMWKSCTEENAPHEATYLKLDCSKIKSILKWKPRWNIEKSVEMVCEWSKVWISGGDIPGVMDRQIREYLCFEQSYL